MHLFSYLSWFTTVDLPIIRYLHVFALHIVNPPTCYIFVRHCVYYLITAKSRVDCVAGSCRFGHLYPASRRFQFSIAHIASPVLTFHSRRLSRVVSFTPRDFDPLPCWHQCFIQSRIKAIRRSCSYVCHVECLILDKHGKLHFFLHQCLATCTYFKFRKHFFS